MEFIICPMCGRQIVERVKECPGCGYPLGHLMLQEDSKIQEEPEIPQDTRTELEKLVDEICAGNDNMYVAIKELRKATGMDLQSAVQLVSAIRSRAVGKGMSSA